MKNLTFLSFFILYIMFSSIKGQWEIQNEGLNGFFNTMDFANEVTGWIAGGEYSPWGKALLLKTEDGGETWFQLQVDGDFVIEMIDFINDSVGWVIGNANGSEYGYILKTIDGGQSWSLQKMTREGFTLRYIQVINDSVGYIIGTRNQYDYQNEYGVILKTFNGGTDWIGISPQNSEKRIYEICHFFDSQIGIVTGYLRDSDTTQQSVILTTDNGGMTWEETVVAEFDNIVAVQFIDDSTGFFSAKKSDQDSCSLYKTTDRLRSWSLINQSNNIRSFFYLNLNLTCAVGGDGIMKSTDGGKTWEEKLPTGNLNMNKLYFWNKIGFCINSGGILFSNSWATILKSTDQGDTWSIPLLSYTFQDVCFVDKDRGFAVGGWLYMHLNGYGDVFITNDGGKTWEVNFSTGQRIESCFFVNPATGFALGRVIECNSDIYKTIDSGKSWEKIHVKDGDGFAFEGLDICFVNEENGWAVGDYGKILKTEDCGENWTFQNSGTDESLQSVYFIDENNGWTVGDGGLIVKYTEENQWQVQSTITDLPLNKVFFSDEYHGWIAGGYFDEDNVYLRLFKTEDGGDSWEMSNFVYQINDIFFEDNLHGWVVGNDTSYNGTILETEDGGNTWNVIVEGLSAPLNAIHFKDGYGWAVGGNGLILRYNGLTWIEDKLIPHKVPYKYELSQNYPNPFNPTTVISWQLAVGSNVELSVYNLLGQKIQTLFNKPIPAGYHEVEFNAQNLSSGVYLYRIEAGEWQDVKKMLLVK